LATAFERIGAYERELVAELLAGLSELPDVKVWGVTDAGRLAERVPTVSITHARLQPRQLAEALAARGIFVWDGNFYALPLSEALGLEPQGMVRIGLLHYNTRQEVERLLAALAGLD
jgi:selenocysteine lyase/cysteine desulfurase